MRPPIGVMAVAIYILFDCVVTLGNTFFYFRSFGIHHEGFWIGLISGIGFGLVGWGLLRLKEWARFISMLAIALWAGARLPLYLARPHHFDLSYFLIVTEEVIDVFAVWYLFRFTTAKHFAKQEKTS